MNTKEEIKRLLAGRKLVEDYKVKINELLARLKELGFNSMVDASQKLPPEGYRVHASVKKQEIDKLISGLKELGFNSVEELLNLENQHAFELAPYSELRGSKFRFILSLDRKRPKQSAARYSAMLKSVNNGDSMNTCVFFVSQARKLTFSAPASVDRTFTCQTGFSQAIVDLDKCRELGISIVRQPDTKGIKSASFTNEGNLNFALCCPAISDATVQYIVVTFLRNLGLKAEVGNFPSTITVNGKIISAFTAMMYGRVGRSSVSIFSIPDYQTEAAIFQKTVEEIRARTTSLQEELGEVPSIADAVAALKKVFTEDFNIEVIDGSYSGHELSLADEIEKTILEV